MKSTSLTASKPAARFSRRDLHGYQERAVEFIKATPSCALWVGMGLGKTVATLTALADLLHILDVGRVLIIAPLRVATVTWPDEIERWGHTRDLPYRVIRGTPRQREYIATRDRAEIHLINRELVPWLVETIGRRGWFYDCVVIDEASSFKSHSAKRFKALRKVLPEIDRLIELTGTPASNGLLDVWSQIYLIDRGARLGKTFTQYRDRYFESDYMGYSWTLREGAEEKIHDKLRDVCLTLAAEDYLELPPRLDNRIGVELPPKARQQYRELEREFLLELEDETVEVLHAAALTNKLLQFANGAIYTDEERNWLGVHDAKLDALADLVSEAAGEPLLVAYNYQTDLARIRARFEQAEQLDKDPETIRRWNRGEIPMLLAHPASAGHGLNLQAGGRLVVWFGLNWSLELYQQFNARLHRQGQQKPVVVHHLAARDTVDGTVLVALERKDTTQRALLNALKTDIRGRI